MQMSQIHITESHVRVVITTNDKHNIKETLLLPHFALKQISLFRKKNIGAKIRLASFTKNV